MRHKAERPRSGAQRFLRVYAVLVIACGLAFLAIACLVAAAVGSPDVAQWLEERLASSGSPGALDMGAGLEGALAAVFLARALVLIATGVAGERCASDARFARTYLLLAAVGMVLSAFSAGYAAFAGGLAQYVAVYATDVVLSVVNVFCGVAVDGQR